MDIIVNGQPRTLSDNATPADLLAELGLSGKRLAVEINESILPRSQYTVYRLQTGDRVEVVHAIGGG
jgi:thiamine biosynthesis protein ThiS